MAIGIKFTFWPYHTLTLVADTSSAITFDLLHGSMVLIVADVVAAGGDDRRRLLAQVI